MSSLPGQSSLRLKHNMLTALLFGAMIAILGVGAMSVLPTLGNSSEHKADAIGVASRALEPALLKLPPPNRAPEELVPDIVLTASNTALMTPATNSFKRASNESAVPAKSILAALPEAPAPAMPYGDKPSRAGLAKVAIIIDDLGHHPKHSVAALKLPRQVALALLPYARASKGLAKSAQARGQEVIVHMPMQPKSDRTNPGPKHLRSDASEAEIRKTIEWNLEQFDGYSAVNNHMGSAFTESQDAMRILFEELSKRGLAFYDSRTTAQSKSVELAARYKVNLAERDVFLDNEIEAGAVDKQLLQLEKLALRNGSAIAIGHPHGVTFAQITAWAETLEEKGLVLVPPSEIMADRRTPYWRRLMKTAARETSAAAPSL